MASETLSEADKEFLETCEEELKDRYTENDEEFMKVFNAEPSVPPIVDPWWVPNSRRNDRRHSRRSHPYERPSNRGGRYQNRDDSGRGYNDYSREQGGYGSQRRRYYQDEAKSVTYTSVYNVPSKKYGHNNFTFNDVN